ncbi:MAG: peptidyl-prolyl cis-trans isomerase [Alistipes sp.]|nr:peptidyl-prolyl cis-trans isomerase [Candidatus Alistipes equi]
MKCLRIIIVIVMASLCVGCWDSSTLLWNDQAVAKVEGTVLSKDELRNMLPENVTSKDSLSYVDAIVRKWVMTQLKIHEAERLFSEDMNDIEKRVSDYRMSLLVKKLDEYWAQSSKSEEITNEMVRKYYDEHRSEFKLSSTIVRGVIVSFSSNYSRKKKLRAMMKANGKGSQEDFIAFCRKNNFSIQLFDEWAPFGDFLSFLPLASSEKHDQLLKDTEIQEISQGGRTFFFRIFEVRKAGESTPLEMTTKNIQKILSNRIRKDVIQRMETKAYDSALEQGKLKFYYSSKEI